MQTRVKKWGNSLGVRIPQILAERLGISEDTAVELSAVDDTITIRPIRGRKSLNELVSKITPDNRHGEIRWSDARGREVW